ncbi:MAG: site-specific DNA-methyltransferase [Opitutus sp.]|nr:site-specific DNA-methyltransferase [Opitutus sp.]MCS6247083.1 site-specific DNA-methyltransferase [Opitutus sp.]MCS6274774.1 site-specific DNA-methyltransferase [Opitutus sp.]MCS6275882.1 site-specific DNA-methyltransferase [Opitutus sp.]MCS6300978.1 site-specific DNA-methyltransferase [Opitutus sp.]
MPSYDHLSKEDLVRLLTARDRRDATRFGLVWEANEIERDQAVNADFVALDLLPEHSVGPGPWRNLIIEGDNFDALRHLRMAYAGEVKCILIDPPYNTGKKDFVYNDRFVDENDSWRFSTWIEFLFQRLIIARDLLSEDGVMLVCINDENRSKLELLLEKVMPGRRVGSFVWRTKDSANDAGGNLSQVHEHVLVYANAGFQFAGKTLTLDDYRNPDNDPEGDWTPQPITCAKSLTERENLYYPIQDPATGYWYPCDPDRVWAYATESRVKPGTQLRADTIEELIRKKEIYFPASKPGTVMQWDTMDDLQKAIRAGKGPVLPKKKTPLLRLDLPDLAFWVGKLIAPGRPSRKDYLKRKTKLVAPLSSWIAGKNEDIDYTFDEMEEQVETMRSERGGEGTDAINAILGNKAFNYPKPPSLIRALVTQATGKNDLVLDFFGGSGTTGHAVLQRNAEDGGTRRFILVSNTESTPADPAKNLCRDVCARRMQRVIEGYSNMPALGGDFAYLRCRRVAPGRMLDIEHAQVWTALQMIHGDTLTAYADAPFLTAGDPEQLLIYIPRFTPAIVAALRLAVKPCLAAVIYSWQPETLRQQVRFGHVEHAAIPESLVLRFGIRA